MENDSLKLTEYDKLSFDNNTQMMKAILPYMPVNVQPGFAYAIMLKEFSNLRRSIRNDSTPELGICSINSRDTSITDILKELKLYANEKQQNFIERILNMFQTASMYQQYMQLLGPNGFTANDAFDFNIDKVMQQLSKEQMNSFNENINIENSI